MGNKVPGHTGQKAQQNGAESHDVGKRQGENAEVVPAGGKKQHGPFLGFQQAPAAHDSALGESRCSGCVKDGHRVLGLDPDRFEPVGHLCHELVQAVKALFLWHIPFRPCHDPVADSGKKFPAPDVLPVDVRIQDQGLRAAVLQNVFDLPLAEHVVHGYGNGADLEDAHQDQEEVYVVVGAHPHHIPSLHPHLLGEHPADPAGEADCVLRGDFASGKGDVLERGFEKGAALSVVDIPHLFRKVGHGDGFVTTEPKFFQHGILLSMKINERSTSDIKKPGGRSSKPAQMDQVLLAETKSPPLHKRGDF